MTIVAIDFDGTLTTDEGPPYWEDPFAEQPNEAMIDVANECFHRGYTVIVYTARSEEVRRATTMWLDRWGVKYHALVMEKLGFDVLVDDRAVHAARVSELGVTTIEEVVADA